MSLRAEYLGCMAAIEYRAEELPGDLCDMALTAEQFAPGYGVKIVMSWAENFRGQPVYWPMLDKVSRKIREKKHVESSEIKSNMINMLADDAIKVCPEFGVYATVMVAMRFRQTRAFLHNLDSLKAPHRDKWIRDTYDKGGVVAWELALAVGLGLRQVEKILSGFCSKEEIIKQGSIFDIAGAPSVGINATTHPAGSSC
jgi:hypothetical protein